MPSASEPASVTEAADTLARAGADGLRVGIEKEGGDVRLSTARLAALLEHEPGDLTAIAQAGIRLSELNAAVAPHGQRLALDPPGDPTLGACIAGNLSGPRRHRYGTARDLVIGLTVVLADGTVASSGGRVVKNVAGYDLGKLFCGSHGRLGLVARAAVRLHPVPAAERTLVVEVGEPAEAERLAQALHRSTLVPSAVDLLWPGRLAVLFEGGERAVEAQLARAGELLGGREDGEVWAEVAERQLALPRRIPFPPGRLAEALDGLDGTVVRVSAGVAYAWEAPPREPGALEERIRQAFDPAGTLV